MTEFDVLILPGWQSSGPLHWQSRWEALHGYRRVEQHDWLRPLRGDWIARLEEVLLARAVPVWLVSHSLGCLLVAAWAAHSRQTARVAGALLVAPADPELPALRPLLRSWAPVQQTRLPFPALLLGSSNDPTAAWRGRSSSPVTGVLVLLVWARAATSMPSQAWATGPKD